MLLFVHKTNTKTIAMKLGLGTWTLVCRQTGCHSTALWLQIGSFNAV